MADILAITVPISGTYPSVNHVGMNGHRAGRKTPEYHRLAKLVRDAAEEEAARVGWKTANYPVEVWLTRYRSSRHRSDASNLGKCEFDQLQASGIVADDHLIRPHLAVEYDPDGQDRVAIVVIRRFPPMPFVASTAPPKAKAKKKESHTTANTMLGSINGVPATRGKILKLLRGGSR